MKNFRKIVAILAAALMLCSVMPLGAFAAPGDVILDKDFEDGIAGFERGYVENGYMVFDATTADWQNTYLYANDMKSDTLYKVTFSAKANKEAVLSFKIQNDWNSAHVVEAVDVTTEWQDYELTVNSGTVNPAIVLFTSGYEAGNAPIYYIDNVKIVETVDPALIGKVVNGDFETGDFTGWEHHQSSAISTDAHSGSYAANIKGNGGWGGMLDQTIPVNAGKAYEITFWLQVNANGINIQIKDGDTSGANIAGDWVDVNKAGSWTQFTYIVRPTADNLTINFCGAGNGTAEDAYVDSFTCTELKDPSFDGYITNGDFETGKTDSWDPVWWAGNISIVEGRNDGYAMQLNHGMYQLTRQLVTVEPNTDYVVQCYAKNVNNMTLLAKSYPADANIAQAGMSGSDNWTQNSLVFNSGDCTQVYIGVMGNVDGATAIVDDFFMFEKVEESNDGYIINGTFETGALTPWNNLWGSCPKAEVIKGGLDSNFALEIVSGQWKHVRQTAIAVEANTDYKITAWAKNAAGMSLLVKDGDDTTDIKNVGVEAGDEWTEFVVEFNSGDYTSIIFSLMGNNAENAYGTFDNIVMEKVEPECEHEYFYPCDPVCMKCYEITNPDAAHNVLHVEAKDATCTENGNVEYWYCEYCGSAWLDADCTIVTNQRNVIIPAAHTYDDDCDSDCNVCEEWRDAPHNLTTHVEALVPANCQEEGYNEHWICEDCGGYFMSNGMGGYYETNPAWMYYTGEHVRPEGAAGCAVVACELCGEDSYGTDPCVRPEGDPVCQDSTCVNCGGKIYGEGHSYGYDEETGESLIPLCQSGTCIHCGEELEYIYEHENGSYAPCSVDGECVYGCGLQYPATGEHAIDNPCEGGLCWMCWEEIPAADHVYDDDYDADCNVCGAIREVEAEVMYGDANGDGEINLRDVAVLQQYTSNWEVTLDLAAADANGDGEVNLRDVALLQQYTSNWEVTLGPVETPEENPLYNDGELGGW